MTIPLSGNSPHLMTDYHKEASQIQAKKGLKEGNQTPLLAKDSLEVPFEKQNSIQVNTTDPGRPFLPPIFQMRLARDRQIEDSSDFYYQALRERLASPLKERLERDERQREIGERNPNFVAFDASLKFEAYLLAIADTLAITNAEEIGTKSDSTLPTHVQQELLRYAKDAIHFLDQQLTHLSSNESSREILTYISQQIKESVEWLNAYWNSSNV